MFFDLFYYYPEDTGGEVADANKTDDTNSEVDEQGADKAEKAEKSADGEPEEQLTLEKVKKLIQSETDRVRTEYVKKLKEKEQELEELRKQQMSEKERKEYEERKRQEELRAKEQEILKREMELLKIDIINELQLPLTFREFLHGENADEIKARAEALQKLFTAEVQKAVEGRFKESGRRPETSPDEREFYSREELEAMSERELVANWDKVQKSLARLGG